MAASQGAVKAGEAYVEAGLRDNKLMRAMRATEAKLKAWGASLVSIGSKVALASAAAITPFLAAARSFADSGAALSDMAHRTNTAAEQLSSLGAAAETVGGNLGDIETALTTTTAALADANTGGIESIRMFNRLGVSVQRLRAMTPDEQFRTLADAIARMRNPFDQAALAAQVFGGAGARLLPMLRQGRAGIEGLEGEARRLGATLSNEDAAGAADFRSSIATLTGSLRGAWQMIGAALAPTLRDLAVQITEVVGSVSRWVRANPGMVRGIFLAIAGIGALGAAVATAGVALIAIGSTIGLVTTAIGLLTSPIVLVVGLLAGATVAFARWTDAGRAATASVTHSWAAFTGFVEESWQGVMGALAAGDMAGAFRIAVLSMQIAWAEYTSGFTSSWDTATDWIATTWIQVVAGFRYGWLETTSFFSTTWADMIAGLSRGWQRFAGFFEGVWSRIAGFFSGDTEDRLAQIAAATEARIAEITAAQNAANAATTAGQQAQANQLANDANQQIGVIRDDAAARQRREAQRVAGLRGERDFALAEASTAAIVAASDREARLRAATAATGGPNTPARLSAVGSFDSQAIRGFAGANTPEERTARATEQAQRMLEQLVQQARNGGIVFA